jgi:hypothetical protein
VDPPTPPKCAEALFSARSQNALIIGCALIKTIQHRSAILQYFTIFYNILQYFTIFYNIYNFSALGPSTPPKCTDGPLGPLFWIGSPQRLQNALRRFLVRGHKMPLIIGDALIKRYNIEAIFCHILQYFTIFCNILQYFAIFYNILQYFTIFSAFGALNASKVR